MQRPRPHGQAQQNIADTQTKLGQQHKSQSVSKAPQPTILLPGQDPDKHHCCQKSYAEGCVAVQHLELNEGVDTRRIGAAPGEGGAGQRGPPAGHVGAGEQQHIGSSRCPGYPADKTRVMEKLSTRTPETLGSRHRNGHHHGNQTHNQHCHAGVHQTSGRRDFQDHVQPTQNDLHHQQSNGGRGRSEDPPLCSIPTPGQPSHQDNLEARGPADQPMGKLHPGTGQGRGNRLAVAQGPVRTPQTVAGDTHDAAHQDQQHRADQCRECQARQ